MQIIASALVWILCIGIGIVTMAVFFPPKVDWEDLDRESLKRLEESEK